MTDTARRRLLAGLIDLGLLLAWGVVIGALFWWLRSAGPLGGVGLLGLNLIGIAAVVLPATFALSALEAGRYEATPGKLRAGLRVRRDPGGERIGLGRSLLRNLLKLGIPWALTHLAVVSALAAGGVAAWAGAALGVAVPVAYLVSLVSGDGRTIYDHVAGTMVILTRPGRRVAEDRAADRSGSGPGGPRH